MEQKFENKIENEKIENSIQLLLEARNELIGIDTVYIDSIKNEIKLTVARLTRYLTYPNI